MIVEIDDPVADNVLRRFTAPPQPFVDALAPPAPEPEPAAAPAALTEIAGVTDNPWTVANELLGPNGVFCTELDPKGRRLIARRSDGGQPPRVEVVEADGARRPVELAANDVYGVALHPSESRALLGLGSPGPVVEVDLETLAATERHPSLGWRAGWLDDTHVVALTGGRLDLFSATTGPLGEPVQSIETGGSNVMPTPGRCFVVLGGGKDTVCAYRLTGGRLVEEAALPVVGARVFFFSAARRTDRGEELGACSWDGRKWRRTAQRWCLRARARVRRSGGRSSVRGRRARGRRAGARRRRVRRRVRARSWCRWRRRCARGRSSRG